MLLQKVFRLALSIFTVPMIRTNFSYGLAFMFPAALMVMAFLPNAKAQGPQTPDWAEVLKAIDRFERSIKKFERDNKFS